MITKEQFQLRQPSMPEETETDVFYFDICKKLIEISENKRLFPSYPEKVTERAALALTGYYQDVISDAGIWRSFITECRRLYGFTVPFYSVKNERYIDYELNKADVRFMVWYALSMNYENRRVCYPFDKEILEGADIWYEYLESQYEAAPIPDKFRFSAELEIHNEEDRPEIMRLANWLFLHCYLMTPAFAMTLTELTSEYDISTEDGILELQKRLDIAMWQDPTGPLALFLGEWLYLIVEGKSYPDKKEKKEKEPHKYYTAFTTYTNGRRLQFFANYEEMNQFFINALGWAEGENHLEQVKNDKDFVLMVDPEKGMLLARNVAKCISSPENPLYDPAYAKEHAMDLLTQRGCCPGDLIKFICENHWLPDAHFPESDDYEIVKENGDFIARCFLQQYYRGD
ncbi:MAG: DUF3843 family protein [Muribaculaceae bacterium]|nr:DUF3843 family protein [Muribaculaceae bacterium]